MDSPSTAQGAETYQPGFHVQLPRRFQESSFTPAGEVDEATAGEAGGRLEGVSLAVREMSFRLNNDLTPALWILELLQRRSDLPTEQREMIAQALDSLNTAVEDIRRFQRVNRVATKDTPFGPTLDLERSIRPWP